MRQSVVARLVRKDLYLLRWLIAGSIGVGLVAAAVTGINPVLSGVGRIAFLSNVVALGIFLGMYSVVQERKDKSLLFALSLPISPRQYALAKLIAILIAFIVPWTVLMISGIAVTAATAAPNGGIPTIVVVMVFLLGNFVLFLAVALSTDKEPWIVAAILLTNISISLFVGLLDMLPSIAGHREDSAPYWSQAALNILWIEAAMIAASIVVALLVQSERKDFI
jgi:ABC-2 type transport system permease protein